MRKLLLALFATLFFMGSAGSLVATAQDDATPESGVQGAEGPVEGTNPIDPAIGDTVTFFGEDGNPAGTATAMSIERGWEDFDEFYEPEDGYEYVAFTVVVESTISRGAIDVEEFDFSLQTAAGYLWSTSFAASSEADPPLLDDSLSLASGDSEEFTIGIRGLRGRGPWPPLLAAG